MQEEIFGPVLVVDDLPHAGRGGGSWPTTPATASPRRSGPRTSTSRSTSRRSSRPGSSGSTPPTSSTPPRASAASASPASGAKADGRACWPTSNPPPTPKPLKPVAAIAGPTRPRGRPDLDRTAKLYIGGKQARPDGGYSRPVWSPKGKLLGHVGARQPQGHPQRGRGGPCRQGLGEDHRPHPRPDPLLHRREPLGPRDRIRRPPARPDRHDRARPRSRPPSSASSPTPPGPTSTTAQAKSVPIRGIALAMNEPCGVIGALCPDEAPLLGLISRHGPGHRHGQHLRAGPVRALPAGRDRFLPGARHLGPARRASSTS